VERPTFTTTRRTVLEGLAASGLAIGSGVVGAAHAADRPLAGPVAATRYGRVAGFLRNGVALFLGVPYGAPTGSARRFLPPVPPQPWIQVRDATRLGQRAPQASGRIYENPMIGPYMTGGRDQELVAMREPEGEDCLVLNVLTPATAGRRPVLVYIHGGGFSSGSGAVMTLADRLVAEEDVVLVTVNHRLGALGFLYLGDVSLRFAAGNPGMLDLVAALRWVRDNICAFGGDPAKVTIFGESGGAAKVGLLAAMPQAQGLFRAAILESGLLPAPIPIDAAVNLRNKALGDMALDSADPAALRGLDVTSLTAAGIAAGPVADGRTLVSAPWATAPATAAGVPMIVGYCADEATLFAGVPDRSTFTLDWEGLPAKLTDKLGRSDPGLSDVVQAYRVAWPADDASDILFRIVSDATFGRDMVHIAERKARQRPPVYYYRFDYDTGLAPGLRAFHTAELPLIGRMVAQPRAERLSRDLAGAWAAFARTGDPNRPGLPQWAPFIPGSCDVMMFDEVSRFGRDPQILARRELYSVLGDAAVPFIPSAGKPDSDSAKPSSAASN